MDPARLRELLQDVSTGLVPVESAVEALRALPFRQVGQVATIDHHRQLRQGVPEVVFGEGKTAGQIVAILGELVHGGGNLLVTRVDPGKAAEVLAALPDLRYIADARLLVLERVVWEDRGRGSVAVVSAGTADYPVAEEAAWTAHLLGHRVVRIYDVGVAGVHRTLARVDELRAAQVLIVIAGMEGALPTVVGGLVSRPVIAVPTSVGYGASFGGLAALLGMMTSCAAGVTVVNIDNGFGAAYAAALINQA
jgi:NCAIR mutase (PurE)-related protein